MKAKPISTVCAAEKKGMNGILYLYHAFHPEGSQSTPQTTYGSDFCLR